MNHLLSLRNVTVRYRPEGPPSLDRCSVNITAGSRVAVLGLNGSGKTTLLRAIAGLTAYDGEIRVDGEMIERRSMSSVRKKIGLLFANPEDQLLFPRVLDDVAFTARRDGCSLAEAREQAREILHDFDVDDLAMRSTHELSRGERLVVALAGLLVVHPPLLLLDEPSAGLDPPARTRLARLLSKIPSAMLIATHDLAFAQRSCTLFMLLEKGKIVRSGSVLNEVISSWSDEGTW